MIQIPEEYYKLMNEKDNRFKLQEGVLTSSNSHSFLKSLENDITDINLYLSQNRYRMSWYVKDSKKNDDKESEPKVAPMLAKILYERIKPVKGNEFYNEKMKILLEELNSRNLELIKSFPDFEEYKCHFPGRMLLGEGGTTPYSNIVLLKLHPLYGVPYLPASTLKGGVRNCWRSLIQERGISGQEADFQEKKLFGCSEKDCEVQGSLVFLDSFPQRFSLALDIQSIHFGDYYGKGKNPTDDQNLNIVEYICLEDSCFLMMIACHRKLNCKEKELVRDAIRKFVEEYGVGAKTALGYGIGEME